MLEVMAQTVLDFYPDSVSQYGLIGCAAFTYCLVASGWVLWRMAKACVECYR